MSRFRVYKLFALFLVSLLGVPACATLQVYDNTWSPAVVDPPVNTGQLSGENWEIDQGSTVVATSNNPQGWNWQVRAAQSNTTFLSTHLT